MASGQTFENVVGINNYELNYSDYYLWMNISKGKILFIRLLSKSESAEYMVPKPYIITQGETPILIGKSMNVWFGFLEDTTISAIEMYNTD